MDVDHDSDLPIYEEIFSIRGSIKAKSDKKGKKEIKVFIFYTKKNEENKKNEKNKHSKTSLPCKNQTLGHRGMRMIGSDSKWKRSMETRHPYDG